MSLLGDAKPGRFPGAIKPSAETRAAWREQWEAEAVRPWGSRTYADGSTVPFDRRGVPLGVAPESPVTETRWIRRRLR
jgi:hypothetical protein